MNAASAKVILWNCQSSMMLEHLNGERVEAIGHFTTDALLPNLQRHRIAHETDKGFFLYKNAETNKLLPTERRAPFACGFTVSTFCGPPLKPLSNHQ
ncbi:hypothetical protein Gpo141_00004963 [Globisporangium polare]